MTKALETTWGDGRDLAIRETGLDPDLFPEDNPFSAEHLLDPDNAVWYSLAWDVRT